MIAYCTYVCVYSKRGGLHITNNNNKTQFEPPVNAHARIVSACFLLL